MANLFERLSKGRASPTEPSPTEAGIKQPRKDDPAQKLLDWLQRWTKDTVSARDIRIYGPNSLRDKKSAVRSAEILVHFGWLAPIRSLRYDQRVWRITRKPIVGPTVAADPTEQGP